MIKLSRLIICLMMTAACSGCFYTSVPEFTDLKLPEKECRKPVSCPDIALNQCQELAMPGPVPNTVYLDIKDGKVIKADAGGESLIRQYMATRKAIKKAWPK